MKKYHLTYTETARDSIRHLPPMTKRAIKTLVEGLSDAPYAGKALKEELSGYWSCRFQSWRVIYIIDNEEQKLEIQLIEKRVSVYETLKELASESH